MGVGDLSDVERPKLGDDIYKHPHRPQMVVMDPQDGLPRVTTALRMEDSKAPALAPETFVCMGDESVFVVRDVCGEVGLEVAPELVRRQVNEYGHVYWTAKREALSEDDRRKLKRLEKERDFVGEMPRFQVTPLRPQCVHYRRVMTDFENTESKTVERVCAAQRDSSGEFQSLRDQRVYACEHRSPRDFVSEERLKKFDAAAVAAAKESEKEWDGEAALAALSQSSGESHG